MSKKKRQITKGTARRFEPSRPRVQTPPLKPPASAMPAGAPNSALAQLNETVQSLWTAYQEKNPGGSMTDFYRQKAGELWQAAQSGTHLGDQSILTPEGHPVLYSKSTYFIQSDHVSVLDTINVAPEYLAAGPSRKETDCLVYNWIQRGRSHIEPETHTPPQAFQFGGEVRLDGEAENFRLLGEVSVYSGRIVLECLSPERLEAGRQLLEEILGFQIRHWRDHYKSPEELAESAIDNLPEIGEPEEEDEY